MYYYSYRPPPPYFCLKQATSLLLCSADLLDVCIDTILKDHTKLDSFTLLRLVCLVIRKGQSCCQFVLPLRDLLPKLKKCFNRAESDKKIQEIVAEITTLLLETVCAI